MLIGLPALLIVCVLVLDTLTKYFAGRPVAAGACAFAVIVTGGIVGGLYVVPRKQIRRELRVCLREQGIRICISCGYDLRGLSSANCPECGEPHWLSDPQT